MKTLKKEARETDIQDLPIKSPCQRLNIPLLTKRSLLVFVNSINTKPLTLTTWRIESTDIGVDFKQVANQIPHRNSGRSESSNESLVVLDKICWIFLK